MGIALPPFPQGTRVRVRRTDLPLNPELVNREGVVVLATPYEESRAGVQLDGESDIRYFGAAELEELSRPAIDPGRAAVRGRLARP
jgi:hypothetical protein